MCDLFHSVTKYSAVNSKQGSE